MNAAAAGPQRAENWIEPLRSALPELRGTDWADLRDFESLVIALLDHPAIHTVPAGGPRLLALRRMLAARLNTGSAPSQARPGERERVELRQTVRQIICGYYDLDLRDLSGLGHGRIIALHGSPACRARWVPALHAGALAGIAMTELTGGTRIEPRNTHLLPAAEGGWVLTGHKTWISRLNEAAVFVVSARGPRGATALVTVDATERGISRERHEPAGLAGWSWGFLHFDDIRLDDQDVLSLTDGPGILKAHFAHYRPLVTATALGAAAAAHDLVSTGLATRQRRAEIDRVRDHALIALGSTHAQISSALLAVLHAQRLAGSHHHAASLWGRTTKAHGVEAARRAADDLGVFIGAGGFADSHRLQKIRRDLDALRYADGMHDSLNRSAGRALLASATPEATQTHNLEGTR